MSSGSTKIRISQSASNGWHVGDPPRRYAKGSVTVYYEDLTIYTTVSMKDIASEYGFQYQNLKTTLYVLLGSKVIYKESQSYPTTWNAGYTNTYSATKEEYGDVSAGTYTVRVYFHCSSPSCEVKWDSSTYGVLLGSATLKVPEPYSAFTLKLNWAKGENDEDGTNLFKHTENFWAKHTISGGTDDITSAYMYASTSNTKSTSSYTRRWSTNKGKEAYTGSYGDSSKLTDGKRYYIYVWATDKESSSDTEYTEAFAGTKSVFTYRQPTLSSVTVKTSFTTNANTANTFTLTGVNTRKWDGTNGATETEFTTYYKIKKESTIVPTFTSSSLGTNISTAVSSSKVIWERSASQMRDLVPYNNGKGDGTNNTIGFVRYSPKAQWLTSVKSVNIILYYRPRVGVTSGNTTYRLNNSSGSTISKGAEVTYTSSLNYIYVSWSYDTTITNAGYTQGYRIRLYNNSGTVVKTYYTTNKYYSIPTSDIPRVYLTYIDITPYYGNGQSSNASASYASNYVYYDSPAKFSFVQLVSELTTPTITYPTASSSWINKDFRVCLQLPTDSDYSSISGTYTYEDIELYVNGTIISLKSGTTSASSGVNVQPSCFSTTDLTYQKKIVIYPNYVEGIVDDSLSYSLKVRVKKQYGASTTNPRWSSWSEMRTFSVSTADYTNYQPQVEDLIMATHYNDVLGFVNRIRNTYGVAWSDIPSSAVANSTLIEASQYSYDNLLDKLNETKSQVNNYATYDSDKEYIKFDYTDELPTTGIEETVGELITAEKNEDNTGTKAGRNYIKYVYDRGILLK